MNTTHEHTELTDEQLEDLAGGLDTAIAVRGHCCCSCRCCCCRCGCCCRGTLASTEIGSGVVAVNV